MVAKGREGEVPPTGRHGGPESGGGGSANGRVEAKSEDFKKQLVGFQGNLRAFALSLCGNPALSEDLAQETLLKAWEKQHLFEEGTNLKAWLFTILRNTYFTQYRKRSREREDVDGRYAEKLSVRPGQFGHMDMIDFQKALEGLTPEHREAITLIGYVGFDYAEAAVIAGVPMGTMKSRLSRARAALVEKLGIDGPSDFGADAH